VPQCVLSDAEAGGEDVVVGLLVVCRARGWIAGVEGGGPCLDESESGAGHLATLATPPVLSDTRLKVPSGLGRDSESEGEAAEAPQLRTVEAMCKANWPAQRRPTEAESVAVAAAGSHARGGAAVQV
jgi:hypothetical protein